MLYRSTEEAALILNLLTQSSNQNTIFFFLPSLIGVAKPAKLATIKTSQSKSKECQNQYLFQKGKI
jgi:hypothetical protein